MRRPEKDCLSHRDLRRRLERPGGILFSTEITAQDQAAQAMRDNVHRAYRRAVDITEAGDKSTQRVSQIFDRGCAWHSAGIEEEAHLAIGLKHLVGDSEGTGKRTARAKDLKSIDEN